MTEPGEYGDAAGGTEDPGLRGQGPDAAGARTGVGPPAAQPAFPWPPGENGSVVTAFGETWKSATFDPGRFFSRLPARGGTGAAVLYYLAIGLLAAGARLFWTMLGQYGAAGGGETLIAQLGLDAVQPLALFLLSPVLLVISLGLSAGVVHVLLVLLGGASNGFDATTRVFCYAYSPMAFSVVPALGPLVGMVWMLVLSVVGLREAHRTDGWKAALAVLLPFVLLAGLVVLALLFVVGVGAALLAA